MRTLANWKSITPSDGGNRLPAGGYVVAITSIEDVADKEYLKFNYDIAEGEFIGYWGDFEKRMNWAANTFYRSYKETAEGMFKHFINCVLGEDAASTWNFNERDLIGKKFGIVLGEEEYEKNDGSIGTRFRLASVKTADEIRKGDYTVPNKKELEKKNSSPDGFFPTDNDIPFA